MTQQTLLKIGGMHCGGCVANVEKALKGVKGVNSARVDLSAGQASIEYDPAQTSPKAMAEAVKKAGFSAS